MQNMTLKIGKQTGEDGENSLRMPWSKVFTGIIVALAVQALMSYFGAHLAIAHLNEWRKTVDERLPKVVEKVTQFDVAAQRVSDLERRVAVQEIGLKELLNKIERQNEILSKVSSDLAVLAERERRKP
jgi:uncharacterized coiled-coil protein SlyX